MFFDSISELGNGIRARKFSPVELVQELLRRIGTYDDVYHAFLRLTPEIALEAAKHAGSEIEAGYWRGPLHGIPYGLKDVIDFAGIPTTAQSRILRDNVPSEHAFVAQQLSGAGCSLIGKLTTHEFAMGGPSFDLPWPPARNPWNADYFSGGSSSGSAVAVAAGFVPFALGTDTRGSIRNPASVCGIVGMKPTYGLVSRRGVVPLAYSLDHVGPLARTVTDNALILSCIAGKDVLDAPGLDQPKIGFLSEIDKGVSGLRIGVIRRFFAQDSTISEEMGRSVEEALRVYEKLGARLFDIDPGPLQDYNAVTRVILIAEAYSVHEKTLKERANEYGSLMLSRVLAGAFISAADYIHAQRQRSVLSRQFNSALAGVDVAITASGFEPPCKIDDSLACEKFYEAHARAPCNLTGNPSLSLPTGFSSQGLPLGIQIIGKPFEEQLVYRVARAYEMETRHFERRPTLVTERSTFVRGGATDLNSSPVEPSAAT
jgi:aspartyl-tRNA(Asn)/glutamyl-tRNA(Gln) amidotransferase subunit A